MEPQIAPTQSSMLFGEIVLVGNVMGMKEGRKGRDKGAWKLKERTVPIDRAGLRSLSF